MYILLNFACFPQSFGRHFAKLLGEFQARHQTPCVPDISIPRTYPRDQTINTIPYTRAGLGWVTFVGVARGDGHNKN